MAGMPAIKSTLCRLVTANSFVRRGCRTGALLTSQPARHMTIRRGPA